ncbi:MAG TPA: hypothetical protein VNF71_02565 [Acidimicrobiales bacterium]|nr:hypothetical protein [Acidimicrobiales bacterium]
MTEHIDQEIGGRLALETELRDLRQRLAVRERSLAEMNRRVVQLERGGTGIAEVSSLTVRNGELEVQNRELAAEIDRLHNTKLFRWTRPARAAYRWAREMPPR